MKFTTLLVLTTAGTLGMVSTGWSNEPINDSTSKLDVQAHDARMSRTAIAAAIDVQSAAVAEPLVTRPYPIDPSALQPSTFLQRSTPQPIAAGADTCPELNEQFITTADLPEGDAPAGIAFTPDSSRFIIAHRDSQNLVIFDSDTRDVLSVIDVTGSPTDLAISADGQYAVTPNLFENTASIIDLVLEQEVAVIDVGEQPGSVTITPDSSTALIGNTVDSTISVIDLSTQTVSHVITGADFWQTTSFGAWSVSFRFTPLVVTPDSSTIVFPEMFDDQVLFIDIASGIANAVSTTAGPANIDIADDGSIAVVSHHFPQSAVTVLDVVLEFVLDTLETGGNATSVPPITLSGDATKAVVAVQNNVVVVDLLFGPGPLLSTGTPNALLTTFDGEFAVVGNFSGAVIDFDTGNIVGTYLDTTTPDYLALSPTDYRAATAHTLRSEFTEVYNANGASGFFEEAVLTGPPPDADKSRRVAVTPDGETAVVIHNHSRNAAIIDLGTSTVTDYVQLGERPGEIEITPDASTAVISNLDSTFVSVVDLVTADVTNVEISFRGGQVAVSPDNQYAYIAVVASGDGVWRVNLDTLAVDGPKILTGNMGGIGFAFDQSSGMTLSPSGETLVTCNSFDNNISIIDTATWTELVRVPVGQFPVRAAFTADESYIAVTNRNGDTVSIVENNGAGSTEIAELAVGDFPFEVVATSTTETEHQIYISNYNDRSISVYNVPSNVLETTIPLPQPDNAGQPIAMQLSGDDSLLFVAANGADFHMIDTASNTITETINTGLAPADLVYSDATQCAHVPSPFGDDGLSVICISDPCACPADIEGDDNAVTTADLLLLLGGWGTDGPGADLAAPNDIIDTADLLNLLGNWGPCP